MSNKPRFSHSHFAGACDRFKERHNISQLERELGMKSGVLHNKFNPACESHKLSAIDLIAIYHATEGDETLFDGMLLECGLTAIAIPTAERAPSLPHQAIDLNAKIASIGQRALELAERGRVSRTDRNSIVSVATSAMGSLALLIHDIEARFQAVPTVACASDLLMQTMTM